MLLKHEKKFNLMFVFYFDNYEQGSIFFSQVNTKYTMRS